MTTETTITLEGKVVINPWGDWADCSPGIYVGNEKIDTFIARKYAGKSVKLIITEIEEEQSK